MEEKLNHTLNQKLFYSYREPFIQRSTNRKYTSFENEEQILFSHKSTLETLLNIIKNFQLEYLLRMSDNKNKNQITKEMIISLKDNLNLMLNEKNKKLNYLINKNGINKKTVQNLLFPNIEETKIIKYNLSLEQKNSFVLEKIQLELINFQIQNEIEKTNFLTEHKAQTISYIRSIPFFFEVNQEIFCYNNYGNLSKVSEFLNEIIRRVRKDFINVVKEKMKKEIELNGILIQTNYIKDRIEDIKLNGCKKYIETEDIIQEESNEFSKSLITNQSKRNSLSSINSKIIINRMGTKNSRGSKKYINLKKERKIQKGNNKFYKKKINSDILNDISNKNVNNYLNMNINVNINLNNNNNYIQDSFNSSLDSNYNDDNNEKNGQYELDLNDNNKIIITPIITNENDNEINSKNSSNNGSFILDIKDN